MLGKWLNESWQIHIMAYIATNTNIDKELSVTQACAMILNKQQKPHI